jgi:hypothetical protein
LNTPTNAYLRKFSSGTILALLAFSGLLILLPATLPALAAQNASLPTYSESPNLVVAATATNVALKITNPLSNSYAITSISVIVPSGWTLSGTFGSCGVHLNTLVSGASASGFQCTGSLAPGFSDSITLEGVVGVASPATSAPPSGIFSTALIDAGSNPASYPGPSFSILSIASTTVAVTQPAGTTAFTAGGSSFTVTATLSSGQPGVPVSWSFTSNTYPTATLGNGNANPGGSLSPSSGLTGSLGTATTTFAPSDYAGDSTTVTATLGTSAISGVTGVPTVTSAAAPSTATITVTTATDGNDYSTTTASTATTPTVTGDAEFLATGVSFSIADSFGNPVAFNALGLTAFTLTLTALSGNGIFDASYTGLAAQPSVITCTNGGDWKSGSTVITAPATVACPSSGSSANIPYNYFQSGVYGSIGKLSLTVTGTYNSGSFSGVATSANLVTSSFSAAAPTLTVTPPTGATLSTVPAGSSVTVSATLATPQAGVPVTLYLDRATSYETAPGAMDYSTTAYFAGGTQGVTISSGSGSSLGTVSDTFAVDTLAGAHAFFLANFAQPTNTNGPTNQFGNSTDYANPAITVAGPASKFTISTFYDSGDVNPATNGASGANLYVDVSMTDAYGNTATNPSGQQIQIQLATSAGTLSVTTAYITTGHSDTFSSLGPITLTLPTAVGTTVTLTASGVLNGKTTTATDSVAVISPLPTLRITSPAPLSGVIYAGSTSVVFSGQANVSSGYQQSSSSCSSGNDCIVSVGYKVDSNAWQSAVISSSNKVVFSLAAIMAAGLHTIQFNATDANGNTVVSSTFGVLVDTAAPSIAFVTANNAKITSGSPITATVVDTEGDLGNASGAATPASGITVTDNGTALASSMISVTGSNAPGRNTTYTVAISGLGTGTHNLVIKALDLAGNTATSSTLTVTVTVAFAQSFVVSGTPHTATIGSFAGINASYTNLNPTAQSVVVFAVFKNSAGQTVGIGTGSLTVGAGATQSVFIADPVGLASGTYSVSIFVVTTGNLPVSVTTTISVTV